MKLLIDMNLFPLGEDVFAASHIEAVHWSAIGKADAPDGIILNYAAAHDFAIFTHDLDFGYLLAAAHADKPSVIQIRMDDLFPNTSAAPVVSALKNLTAEIEQRALIMITSHKIRIHILPFTCNDE